MDHTIWPLEQELKWRVGEWAVVEAYRLALDRGWALGFALALVLARETSGA